MGNEKIRYPKKRDLEIRYLWVTDFPLPKSVTQNISVTQIRYPNPLPKVTDFFPVSVPVHVMFFCLFIYDLVTCNGVFLLFHKFLPFFTELVTDLGNNFFFWGNVNSVTVNLFRVTFWVTDFPLPC